MNNDSNDLQKAKLRDISMVTEKFTGNIATNCSLNWINGIHEGVWIKRWRARCVLRAQLIQVIYIQTKYIVLQTEIPKYVWRSSGS